MGGISTQCENKALGIKLLDLAYMRIKYSFISSLLVSVLIVTALWPAVDRGKLAVWLLSMWLVVLMRNFIAQRYLNPGRGDTVEFGKWKNMLAIGAAASGVCWGVTVFFIPASSLDQATLLLIFVIAGVTAFASVSLATVPVAAIAFLLSALLPMVVWLFSFGERVQFFMGVIALSYLGGMLLFSRQMYKLMLNSFWVIEQNRALTSVLQESDQRIAHYFESAPGFFYTVLKRSDGSYAMPFASAGIRDLFGLDPADVAHDMALLAAMAHPDDSEMTLRKIEQSAKNMTPYHVEYRIVHPQKGVRWMEAHLLPHPMSESGMRWDGFMHDITERKQMEKELHLREQMFRTLAENAPDPILRYDLTCRRIYSNAALTRISGMSADALAGTLPEGVPTLPSDENTKLIRCIRQVLETGKLAEGEIKFVLRDGSIRIFNNRYAPEFGTDGAVVSVLTFATDITEIKRLEGELCRQVEFQQTLLNALCDVGIQLMMIENGRVIHVGNRELARQFGYSDADLDAQPELADFIHPDDRMRVMEYYLHRLKGDPVPSSYELGLITRAGERREYEIAVAVVPGSDPVRVITVGKDITERKQMEEELAARERDFRSLADSSPDSVIRYDLDHRILYLSDHLVRDLKLASADEVIGKRPIEVWPDGRFAAIDDAAKRVIASGTNESVEPVWTQDSGDARISHIVVVPERDVAGKIVGTIAFGRDITAIRSLEKRHAQYFAVAPGLFATVEHRADGSYAMPFVSTGIRDLFALEPDAVMRDIGVLVARAHPDDAEMTFRKTEESERDLTLFHVEYRIIHPIKGVRWLEVRSMPHRLPDGGTRWDGFYYDITERKEIENVLHRSQESLAEAQRISKVGNWELDLVTNNLIWSDEIFRIFEIDSKQFGASYEAFLNVIHPDDREAVNIAYSESLASRTPYMIEHRLLMDDGRVKFVQEHCETHYNEDGKPLRSLGTVQDITERKRMENELKRREHEFRRQAQFQQSLLSNLRDAGIILVMVENGKFVYTNDDYVGRQLGYAEGELPETVNFIELIHPDDRPRIAAMHRDRLDGKPVPSSYEIGALGGDGSRREYEFHVTTVPDTDPPQTLLLTLRIDERKRMESELKRREQEFRSLADNMPDNVVRWDVEGRYLYINSTHERTLGAKAEDIIGKFIPDSHEQVKAAIAQVVATGKAIHTVRQQAMVNGVEEVHDVGLVPEFDDSGKLVSVLGLGRNMTDFYRLQDDLKAGEQQLRSLADSSPGMLGAFYARPDGSVCMPYVSPNIEKLFGIYPQDVTHDASALMALNHPDDARRVVESIAESARNMTLWHEEYRILHPVLGERWMETNTMPTPHPDGGVIWYGYIHDITERKNAEHTRKKLARALKLLSASGMLLVHAKNEQKLLEDACRFAVEIGGYRMAWVGFAENDEHKTVRPVAQSGFEDGYLDGINVTWADTERGQVPIGIAIRTGSAAINHDFQDSPELKPWREAAIKRGYRSSVALPLVGGGQVLGSLNIYSAEVQAFGNNEEVALLQELADNVALGIGILRTRAAQARMAVALAAREHEYRTLVENIPEVVIRYDMNCHRIYVNPAMVQLTGRRPEEMIGETPLKTSPLVDPEGYMAELRKVMESGISSTLEFAARHQNGEQFVHSGIFVPEFDVDRKLVGVLVVARDITAIRETEHKLSHFIDNLPGLAYTFRLSSEGQANFPYVSSAIREIYGLEPEEAMGDFLTIHNLAHPDDRPRIEAAIAESVRTMQPYRVESRVCRPGSPERWLDVRSAPESQADGSILWYGLMLDITERKRIEAQVAQERATLRTFFGTLPDLAWMKDTEGRYLACNPLFEQLYGATEAELLGKTDFDFVDAELATFFRQKDKEAEVAGKPCVNEEWVTFACDGRRALIETVKAPVVDAKGKVIGVIGVAHDITERKRMESELLESRSFLNKIIDSIPDPIFVKDKEHRWVLGNEAFCHLIGQPREQLIGKSDYDFLPKEQADVFWEKDELVFKSGETNLNEEVITDTHGETRYLHTKKTPFAATDGTGMLVGVIRDISDRKQAEDALRESQEKLGELFKLSPLGLALTDMQGRYVEFNEAFRAICGYPAEELMTLDYWTLTPKEYEAREAEQLESLAKTGRYGPYEKEYRKKDGTRTPIQLSGTLIAGHEGQQYIWSIVEDISERKRAEQRLQQAVAFSEGIINALPDILFEVDQEGRYLNVWTHNLELLAAQKELLLGNTISEILSPDAAEIAMSSIREAAEKGLSFGKLMCIDLPHGLSWFELSVSKKSGDDFSGLRFLVLSRDVTTRKLAEDLLRVSIEKITGLNQHLEEIARNMEEQAVELEVSQDQLKQTEEWYRSILLSAPDGMLVFDERGVIRQVNKQLVTMFGYTDGELQGSHIEMLLLPAIREHHVHQRTDLFAGGIVASPMVGTMNNLRGCRKDGLEFPVDVSLSRLPDLDGRVGAICASIRDISDRKAIETARENALAEAIRLAEMRSTFLSQMSHELRTPLNGILGFEQLLQMDSAINEGQRAKLHIIRESGEHLLALVNQILDYAKIEADKLELNLEDMQLDAFLDTVVGIIGVRAEQKKLAFVYEADGDLSGIVRGDELRLRQVLLNLLANAIKFTDCGEVSLRVSMPVSARIRFEVRDSGIGIAESQWEAIFQPFEQLGDASRIAQGTGLGLAISRKLVRLMGGDIKVESQPGAGSMFSFEIEMETVRSGEVKLNADALTKQAATSVTPMTPHIVAPPQQELDTMHGLAMRGNMRDIMQHATRLAELDERYSPFSNYVCQLCKGFQTKALMSLIAQYRNEKEIE